MKKNHWIKLLPACFIISCFFLTGKFASAQALLRDTEFNNNLSTTNSETRCMHVIEEGEHRGKLLAGGFFNSYNGNFSYSKLVRLNEDGTIDATFASQSYTGGIYTIAVQPWDNKIIVGGEFTRTVGGVTYTNIMRLNEDGSVDNTFNPTGSGTDGTVWKVLALNESTAANRRIVIGGVYKSYKGSSIVGSANQGGAILVRENGNLAKNLNVTEGAWTVGGVYCMALDNSGNILIGGEFGLVNGVRVRRAARLLRNGDLDPAFLNRGYDGVGPGSSVYAIAAQPSDNKILIAGAFTTYVDMSIGQFVNNTRTRIARLETDGYLDKDFNFAGGVFLSRGFNDMAIRDMLIASNGKILVGGNFTAYDGVTVNRVARLNRDGSLDNSLNIGSGFDNIVHDIAFYNFWRGGAMEEAQILVAGNFTRYNGSNSQPNMVRLRNAEVLAAFVTNFTAFKVNENKVRISWKMTKANAEYQLQRSYDGNHFQTFRTFTSSSADAMVTTFDEVNGNRIIHYRIAVGGRNNGFATANTNIEYSSTVTITGNTENSTAIWKTNSGQLRIRFDAAMSNSKLVLQAVSISGHTLWVNELNHRQGQREITLPLSEGHKQYFIILSEANGQVLSKTFVY